MRAARTITWLLLSLSMCSADMTTAATSKTMRITNPTTAIRTAVPLTTATTSAPQTTSTPEATTVAKTTAFSQTTQLTTRAATTSKTVPAGPTNKPEPSPAPTSTGPGSLFRTAATPGGPQSTPTLSLPAATSTSQSRTTAQITPADKSPVQTTTRPPSPGPSGVSKLPSAGYSSQGPSITTGVPKSSPTTEPTTAKIPPNFVTTQQDSSSGTRPGSTGPTSPEAGTTVTTTLVSTAPTQATSGPPDAGTFLTTAGSSVSTVNSNLDQQQKFTYSLLGVQETSDEKHFPELCQKLMLHLLNGTCTLRWRSINNKVHFDSVEINGQVKTTLAEQYYGEMTEADAPKTTDYKTLIAILASCGALLIMIIILTVCASHHRKPCSENQQYLTEELHTVENCYHDNPTLEVMEAPPEMQEKKVALNGEFNDSWIVPIDNLMKDDVLDEEDTHL